MKTFDVEKDWCSHYGNKIAVQPCDVCHEPVPAMELNRVIDINKAERLACNYCESISSGKHTFEHRLKMWKLLPDNKARYAFARANYNFAFLRLMQLEGLEVK